VGRLANWQLGGGVDGVCWTRMGRLALPKGGGEGEGLALDKCLYEFGSPSPQSSPLPQGERRALRYLEKLGVIWKLFLSARETRPAFADQPSRKATASREATAWLENELTTLEQEN
jgi:hypothetical protein